MLNELCFTVLQPDLKRDWKNFCDYIKDKCSQLDMDKTKVEHVTPSIDF